MKNSPKIVYYFKAFPEKGDAVEYIDYAKAKLIKMRRALIVKGYACQIIRKTEMTLVATYKVH